MQSTYIFVKTVTRSGFTTS